MFKRKHNYESSIGKLLQSRYDRYPQKQREKEMAELLNVDKAIASILENIPAGQPEAVPLLDAHHRILAEDIHSPVNLPPFANSAMDGYAILASNSTDATEKTSVTLQVVMDIPAGVAPEKQLLSGEAARIMTGAPVPPGADTVIPVEDTDSTWAKDKLAALPEQVKIYRQMHPGDNIRQVGENVKTDEIVLHAGKVLRAADIGILAAIGQATVPVMKQPRVAILSSGDELLGVEDELTPGKIRDVNSYTLATLVKECGGVAIRMPVAKDNLDAVRQLFTDTLAQQPDMILSSAGVSAGATDLIRMVLEEMGEINFWKINLRPGKPLASGRLGDIPFFGLPGNPVSAMVTFEVLVRPALHKMGGHPDDAEYRTATIAETITSDGRRSYIRVKLKQQGNNLIATHNRHPEQWCINVYGAGRWITDYPGGCISG